MLVRLSTGVFVIISVLACKSAAKSAQTKDIDVAWDYYNCTADLSCKDGSKQKKAHSIHAPSTAGSCEKLFAQLSKGYCREGEAVVEKVAWTVERVEGALATASSGIGQRICADMAEIDANFRACLPKDFDSKFDPSCESRKWTVEWQGSIGLGSDVIDCIIAGQKKLCDEVFTPFVASVKKAGKESPDQDEYTRAALKFDFELALTTAVVGQPDSMYRRTSIDDAPVSQARSFSCPALDGPITRVLW